MELIEHIDYYKEGDRVVFTALFHSKRGFCCGSLCRHCPYEPKHIKYSTKMDLEKLKELQKQAEMLESENSLLTPEEKAKQAAGLFDELNVILQEILQNKDYESIA